MGQVIVVAHTYDMYIRANSLLKYPSLPNSLSSIIYKFALL